MAFLFRSAKYHFPAAWTAEQQKVGRYIFKEGTKAGAAPADMMKMMKRAGISYRKTNMLADISRAKAVEQSRTVEAYNRAEAWYETLSEVKDRMELKTYKEAADFMTRWKTESWETAEEAELASKLETEDRYTGTGWS